MAKTLLENIQKQLAGPQAQQAQPGMTDEGAKAQQLLRAKLGKAAASDATPKASAIQEQQQVKQAQLGAQQLQQQGRIAAEEIGQRAEAQQVEEQEQMANFLEKRKDLQSNFENQSNNILQELERGGKELDSKKRQSKMEQLGFMIRLQNERYVNDLQMQGERARLDNDLNFKEELTRKAFADRSDLLQDKVTMQKIADMNDRDYLSALENMSAENAYKNAKAELKAEKAKQKQESFSKMISIGGSFV